MRYCLILTMAALSGLMVDGLAQNPLEWLFDRDQKARPFEEDRRYRDQRPHDKAVRGVRASERGKGTLSRRGPNVKLDAASVTLSRSGEAAIQLASGDTGFRFSGSWKRATGNRALVTIKRAYERIPARGTATVTLRQDGGFDRLEVEGESIALQGDFSVVFVSDRATSRRGSGEYRLEKRKRGRGTLQVGRETMRLTESKVFLRKNGEAIVRFSGRGDHIFKGYWSRRDASVIDLHFEEGPEKMAFRGTGVVILNEIAFSKVTISGRLANGAGVSGVFVPTHREYVERDYRGTNDGIRGYGTLTMRGPDRRVDQLKVELTKAGGALLHFDSGEDHFHVEGAWYGCQDADVLELEIEQIEETSASGTGKIFLHRGKVQRVELSGSSRATRGPFELRFQRGDPRRPHVMPDREGHREHALGHARFQIRGNGRYACRVENTDLSGADVHLRQDGTAAVILTGGKTYAFSGTWRPGRPGAALLNLSLLANRVPIKAEGTVVYEGDRLTSVQIKGTSRTTGPFQVGFQSARPKIFRWRWGR